MKRKMSLVLVLMLLFTTVIPVMAFSDEDDQSLLQEQYEKVYRNKGYLYDLPYGLAKRDGDLPYGLAKRNGNLPYGLAKRGVLPVNVINTLNFDAFEDFVEAVIDAYDGKGDLIDELEDLLEDKPLDIAAIMTVLDKLFDLDEEEESFSEWALAQAGKFDADEDQMDDLEAMLDEEPIDEEEVEEWLEDLEEAYDLAMRIEAVYETMETYGADQDLIDDIEDLLDVDDQDDIDWDAIEALLEALILDSDIYADALEAYEDLVEDIDKMIEDEDFEWPDNDTEESFEATYNLYNDLEDPIMAEINEANIALAMMKAYLELDNMYSIEQGEDILDELKDDLQDLVDTLDFGTGKGEYDLGLQTMLEELIDQINNLSDPTIFDIIALKGTVEDMLESYEDMRYIIAAERHDFIIKRYEVLSDYLYDDLNDAQAEELYTMIDEFELPYGSMVSQYLEFLDLYDTFMAAVD